MMKEEAKIGISNCTSLIELFDYNDDSLEFCLLDEYVTQKLLIIAEEKK